MKLHSTRTAWLAEIAIVATALFACGGASSKATTATTAAAAASAGAPSTAVKATGGGSFCTKLAAAINNGVSRVAAAAKPGSADSLKAEFQASRQEEQDALNGAPNAIKSDLKAIVDATNKVYDALAAVNYDFTKVDPTTFSAFNTPALQTATQHVTDYVKRDCGIDLSGGASTTTP